jgi:hypothetical protein
MLLRVKDLSKFGTFVKKESDAKAIALAGQETELREGDVVTFGTNKTSFRSLPLSNGRKISLPVFA